MDTKFDSKIPKCGGHGNLAKLKFVVGSKQLRKALQKNTARCVFLAENADPMITEPLAEECEKRAIPITWVPTMADLGRACGIEVGAAAAAAVD